MKVVSWTVRQLENEMKRVFIKKDLGLIRARWVMLQETKLSLVDCFVIN